MQVQVNWPDNVPAVIKSFGGKEVPIDSLPAATVAYIFDAIIRETVGNASAGTRKEMEAEGASEDEILAQIAQEREDKFNRIVAGDFTGRRGPRGPRGSKRDTIFKQVALEKFKAAVAKAGFALPKADSDEYKEFLATFTEANKAKIDEETDRRISSNVDEGLVLPTMPKAA